MRITAFAMAAVLAISGNARAQDATYNQERIDLRKYDLNKPHDAKALLSRIEGAALNVCGASPGTPHAIVWDALSEPCYRDTVRMAVERAHLPSLTLAYDQRQNQGRPSATQMAAR